MIGWIVPWICLGALDGAAPVAPPPPGSAVATIALRPATVPRPALKYHLVPERYGLVPGNAALFYHRGILLLAQQSNAAAAQTVVSGRPAPSADDQVAEWINLPLGDLPRAEVRAHLDRFSAVIHEVELGAGREQCDWGLDHRAEGVGLLLPEIQSTRSLARLVILQARLLIAEGQLDPAWQSIQTGMVLARHIAAGPSLIQGLIGTSIGIEMSRCLELLVGSPGAPSYFWALADRPRPLVDLRAAFEDERHILDREFPLLLDLDRGVWSLEQTRRFVDQLQSKVPTLFGGEMLAGFNVPIPPDTPPSIRRLALATLCAKIEPEARRALIRGGRAEAEVAALPVVQAALLAIHLELQERRDLIFRWVHVPYPASVGRLNLASLSAEEKQANPLLALFAVLESGVAGARIAPLRLDRQLDALQVVEAIRLDATRNGGRLPANLDAIRDLPIPLDPATGKPFDYRVEGDSAVISAPSLVNNEADPTTSIQIRLVPPQR